MRMGMIQTRNGANGNRETYKKIAILRGHKKQIHKLTIHENKLHSVELNGTIRIWKF